MGLRLPAKKQAQVKNMQMMVYWQGAWSSGTPTTGPDLLNTVSDYIN